MELGTAPVATNPTTYSAHSAAVRLLPPCPTFPKSPSRDPTYTYMTVPGNIPIQDANQIVPHRHAGHTEGVVQQGERKKRREAGQADKLPPPSPDGPIHPPELLVSP